eukprot:Clim_evm1s158 gene=Clim_evmTU1s158
MRKLNTQAFVMLVMSTVAHTASVSFPSELPQLCPRKKASIDVSVWEDRADLMDIQKYWYILSGNADMTELSQFVVQQGTDFEDYMWSKKANLQYQDDGAVNMWASMMWTLNVLAGPVLAAPYYIARTDENADDWDAWWNAVHDLTPYNRNSDDLRCDTEALQDTFKPWAIGFPVYFLEDGLPQPLDTLFEQKSKEIDGRVWATDASTVLAAPQNFDLDNTTPSCIPFPTPYEKDVTDTTTVTTGSTVSDTLTIADELSFTEKASVGFEGLGASVEDTVKSSVTDSFTTSFTTTLTTTESTTIKLGATPTFMVPPGVLFSATISTEQLHVKLSVAGDITYDENSTGVQTWIQGDVIDLLYGEVSDLLSAGSYASFKDIKTVLKMSMNLIGADWSDEFVDSLLSATVSGTIDTQQGSSVTFVPYLCDAVSLQGVTHCDETLQEQFPASNSTTCDASSKRRDVAQNQVMFEIGNTVVSFDDPCVVDVEPAEDQPNAWRIVTEDGCFTEVTR